jgi:hypothetical protein
MREERSACIHPSGEPSVAGRISSYGMVSFSGVQMQSSNSRINFQRIVF